jgi:diguanylate cyclase (GGDEF)-like protein
VTRKRDANTTQRIRVPSENAMAVSGAVLVVIKGERLGARVELTGMPLVIGRGSDAGFRIDHRSVSRQHCRFTREGEDWRVEDLGSTNRTLVNGAAIESAVLSDGDRITIGETVLKFVYAGSVEAGYHQALYELATVDSLTGLYNRRKFREVLETAVTAAIQDDTPMSVVFIDLDHFKRINDALGHGAGDEVLRQFGQLLRDRLVDGEMGGRLGGEEFAVCLPGIGLAAAALRAEALRAEIAATPLAAAGRTMTITASFGVASWHPGLQTAADLMRDADAELMRAKHDGRDRVCVATPPGPDRFGMDTEPQ